MASKMDPYDNPKEKFTVFGLGFELFNIYDYPGTRNSRIISLTALFQKHSPEDARIF